MLRTCVVMLTWNRLNTLKNTISTFRKYNPDVKDEDFIIVDNGSNDGTKEFLENSNYYPIINNSNLGAQLGKFIGWKAACKKGYDFIIFIEDDHPCYRKIPIKDLENYLDKNKDIGIIRLNDKKYLKRHQITRMPIECFGKVKLNNKFFIKKYNYHFTSHPSIFRTSLVSCLKGCVCHSNNSYKLNFDDLNFNKYKGTKKYKLAKERVLTSFGTMEKEYMRLYLLNYNLTAQLNPPCFQWLDKKRMSGWKN